MQRMRRTPDFKEQALSKARPRGARTLDDVAAELSMPLGTTNWGAISLVRGTSGRTKTALPVSSTPCTAKTFFARSIPTVTIALTSPSNRQVS
jgi:hypothetical protein